MNMRKHVGLWGAAVLSVLACLVLAGGSQQTTFTPVAPTPEKRITNFKKSKQDPTYKYVIQWFDATANFERLSTRQGVRRILDKCKAAGIDAVAVGVRPLSGHTMYRSRFAPQLTEWKGFKYPPNYDLLQTVIEEAHQRDIDVHALVMLVSEGHKSFDIGPVYTTHPGWASMVYDIDIGNSETTPRIKPITQLKRGALNASIWAGFCNPILPDLQEHELKVVEEVLHRYQQIDAFVVDRVRYNGLNSDFSSYSRGQFEAHIGKRIEHWPEDIFKLELVDGKLKRTNGRYFKEWCAWRARNIQQYMQRIVELVRRIRPDIPFGDYVGSWYPTYYEYGVNWGRRRYIPTADWAAEWYSPGYEKTGYAEDLDYLAVGCYFPYLTKEEAEQAGAPWWNSVEGGCEIAKEATMDVVPIYASIYAADWRQQPQRFAEALRLGLRSTNGLKIFDLSQIEEYDYWDEITAALKDWR